MHEEFTKFISATLTRANQTYNKHSYNLLHQDLITFLSFPKAYFVFKSPDFFFVNQAEIHQQEQHNP